MLMLCCSIMSVSVNSNTTGATSGVETGNLTVAPPGFFFLMGFVLLNICLSVECFVDHGLAFALSVSLRFTFSTYSFVIFTVSTYSFVIFTVSTYSFVIL